LRGANVDDLVETAAFEVLPQPRALHSQPRLVLRLELRAAQIASELDIQNGEPL